MAKKKNKEDQLMEHLFGQKPQKEETTRVTDTAGILAGVSQTPMPNKRLVPKKIIAKDPDMRCVEVLADNWNRLREMTLVKYREDSTYSGYSAEDILIESFEYVIRDEEVKGATEEKIIDLFIYRFDNLMWAAKMNRMLEKRILARGEIDPVTFGSDNEKTK